MCHCIICQDVCVLELDFSVWLIWSDQFRLSHFGLAVSVTDLFSLGRFSLETFQSDYEIL